MDAVDDDPGGFAATEFTPTATSMWWAEMSRLEGPAVDVVSVAGGAGEESALTAVFGGARDVDAP